MPGPKPTSAGITAVLLLLFVAQAAGFGTVSTFGQNREHERITRAALACPAGKPSDGSCFEPSSLDSLAGARLTFGAVGAPDIPPPDPAHAHCDEGDYLDPARYPRVARYPRTRAAAVRELRACRRHLQQAFRRALGLSSSLLDANGRILASQVNLAVSCTFAGGLSGRAKCDAYAGFGAALHGVQDFYSHTNWSDRPVPARLVDDRNPPGLGKRTIAPLLDMRRSGTPPIPPELLSGCFSVHEVRLSPVDGCRSGLPFRRLDRVRHEDLNKDKGTINPVTGAATAPKTKRGRIGDNFANAVRLAIADTRRQWSDLRAELVRRYGPRRGNLMICALTRDDPVNDCQGRRLAIVVDSSGSNVTTDPSDLRIGAARAFNAGLTAAAEAGDSGGADLSTVVDFDSAARVVSPLGDPDAASFAGIDSSGGTNIAAGVTTATDELLRDGADVAGRAGIVVFTDGRDSSTSALVTAIGRAGASGIRVSIGFLRPPASATTARALGTVAADAPTDVVEAVIATGGFYGTIDSAERQAAFVRTVVARGATALDDPNGADDGGVVEDGVAVTGSLDGARDTDVYELTVVRGRVLNLSVTALDGQTPKLDLIDIRTGKRAARGLAGTSRFRVRGTTRARIVVRSGSGPYTLSVDQAGVTLRGTNRREVLRCGDEPTLVLARAGNDRVICGDGDDLIEAGPGADLQLGGGGSDLFIVRARERHRGRERIDGGPGFDAVEFDLPLSRGSRCRRNAVNRFRLGESRYELRNVERISFRGRRCL